MRKKTLSLLLTLCMVLSLLPTAAFAVEGEEDTGGEAPGFTVSAITPGTVGGPETGTPARTTVTVSDATITWSPASENAKRPNDAWWVGFKVSMPAGTAEKATYRTVTNWYEDKGPEAGTETAQAQALTWGDVKSVKGYKLDGGVSLDTFSDAAAVADYAKDAMSWAVGNGIVQGTGSGALNPEGPATRAHFAAFLHRFCQTAGL